MSHAEAKADHVPQNFRDKFVDETEAFIWNDHDIRFQGLNSDSILVNDFKSKT